MHVSTPLPIGTVSAILTISEFLVGSIAVICINQLFVGSFLLYLRAQGSLTTSRKRQKQGQSLKQIILFLFATWLTIFIALVEFGLNEIITYSDQVVQSENCAFLGDSIAPGEIPSPWKYKIDDVSIQAAEIINCEKGIKEIDFGTTTSPQGVKIKAGEVLLPVCNSEINYNEGQQIEEGEPFINVSRKLSGSEVNFDLMDRILIQKNIPYVFPYKKHTNLSSSNGPKVYNAPISQCQLKGIRSVPFTSIFEWDIKGYDDSTNARNLLQRLCESHNETERSGLEKEFQTCLPVSQYEFQTTTTDCIRSLAEEKSINIHRTELSNVAALLVFMEGFRFSQGFRSGEYSSRSLVCPDATVQVEYVLSYWYGKKRFNPTIIPLSFEVTRGYCETGMELPSFSALLYEVKSEWDSQTTPAEFDRATMYHAFLISLVRRYYDFTFLFYGSFGTERNCSFSKSRIETEFTVSAPLWILIASTIFCILVIFLYLALRCLFRGRLWNIRTYMDGIGIVYDQFNNDTIAQLSPSLRESVSQVIGSGNITKGNTTEEMLGINVTRRVPSKVFNKNESSFMRNRIKEQYFIRLQKLD